jgi:hypothetical protein
MYQIRLQYDNPSSVQVFQPLLWYRCDSRRTSNYFFIFCFVRSFVLFVHCTWSAAGSECNEVGAHVACRSAMKENPRLFKGTVTWNGQMVTTRFQRIIFVLLTLFFKLLARNEIPLRYSFLSCDNFESKLWKAIIIFCVALDWHNHLSEA